MDYSKLKVIELNELCTKHGLKTTGKKQDLIDRLLEHDAASTAAAPAEPKPEPAKPEKMTAAAMPVAAAPSASSTTAASVAAGAPLPDAQALKRLSHEDRLRLRAQRFGQPLGAVQSKRPVAAVAVAAAKAQPSKPAARRGVALEDGAAKPQAAAAAAATAALAVEPKRPRKMAVAAAAQSCSADADARMSARMKRFAAAE